MLLERRLGDKLWTFDQPVKAVLEHQKPLAKQSKPEKLAYAMLTKILTEEDLVTLHNKFAHCSLPVLKILFPINSIGKSYQVTTMSRMFVNAVQEEVQENYRLRRRRFWGDNFYDTRSRGSERSFR